MNVSAPAAGLVAKDFLSILDLAPSELAQILDLATSMKADRAANRPGAQPLARKHVALLFEKPSLRTRTTFTVAVRELGGEIVELPPEATFGGRETLGDVAKNLERWVAGVVVRTFAHAKLETFAAAAQRMHVVNALTNEQHPCQILADMLTLRERFGTLRGRTLAYLGDGNNVATSLAHAGAMLGLHIRMASPRGFELPAPVVEEARRVAESGGTVELTDDPVAAVEGADAVYTDVWASMGQEKEAAKRARIFRPYQVTPSLMDGAAPDAIFMHCLPAHRGAEVTDAVIDSSASVVFDQAENRLHTQKALLAMLLG